MESFASGRFEISGLLGAGGAAKVFRAYDHVRRHEVALKVLNEAHAHQLIGFKNEFRLLTELSHPNIITLYELIADGVVHISMPARRFWDDIGFT